MFNVIFSLLKTHTMNTNKALWEKGDFTKIADTMRESSSALVAKLGIKPGMDVLDVACGDGDTAIPAAKTGANVTGVDIAQNLVEAGNSRAEKEGVADRCKISEGDVMDLKNQEDASFDLVMSIFGAMFAPRPFDTAKELVRVTRKGGRIIMGNWIPGDPTFVAQILKISSAYTPPPPEGFVSPMLWGVEDEVIRRFESAGVPKENISFSRETFTFIADYSPSEFLNNFRNYYGPTMNAFEAAEKNGREEALQQELEALFISQNKSGNDYSISIPATFLLVKVMCP
ncbi:MAG: methyltransferase domain-containing protein [Chitinophagaceae bacterium]